MQGIPDVKDTDAEDVVWGLQTAASLWKRGERIDALVWLRRAAQAAGEANDDDRALELARSAAELSDWMATLPPGSMSEIPPSHPNAARTVSPNAPTFMPGRDDGVLPPAESEPRSIEVIVPVETESSPHPVFPPPAPSSKRPPAPRAKAPAPARPQPPPSRPPSQPTMQTPEPTFEREPHPSQPEEEHSASVPPADKVHAGMFNPWDDTTGANAPEPPAPPPPPRTAPPRAPSKAPARARPEEEEVVTSIRPQAPSRPAPAPPRPPPLPARAKPPKPPPPRTSAPSETRVQVAPSVPPPVEDVPQAPTTDEDLQTSASSYQHERPPPMTPVPPSPTQQMDLEERERLRRASLPPGTPEGRITRTDDDEVAPRDDGEATPAAGEIDEGAPGVAMPDFSAPPPPLVESTTPPAQLDLEGVDAFADLPDDARAAFAAAATLSELREGEEVSHFALAYVLRGSFDVSATMVDAAAARLQKGAVLRARGTTEEGVPMRLVCASPEGGLVATWSDAAVDEAFRTIPWVEEDLRAAADRVQTLVGITIGPLGERLDVSIREQIVGRLQMRQVLAGEVVVTEGEVVPGLLLVGVGELELVQGGKVTGTVSSGDFLFATEVLGAGNAPATARAGAGGALVLFGDRTIAQELLVTCPPLLEVFAGM